MISQIDIFELTKTKSKVYEQENWKYTFNGFFLNKVGMRFRK